MRITLHKTKQYLAPILKIAITVGCFYFLYTQWQANSIKPDRLITLFKDLHVLVIPLMIVLSLCSWLVESVKWQVLIRDFVKLRFRESVLQNLTAQAASFITPLRAGEVAFKVLFYKNTLRKEVAGRAVVGTISQMLVTTIVGIAAGFLLLNNDLDSLFLFYLVATLFMVLAVLGLLWLWKKYNLKKLSLNFLGFITSLSLLRYVFFASNWLLILQAINYDMSLWNSMIHVAVMYFLISVIPIIQLADVTVRLTTAAVIFNHGTFLSEPILFATLVVWFTNTVLPTLLGCLFLPGTHLKTSAV